MERVLSSWWLMPVGGFLLSCLVGLPLCNRSHRLDAASPRLLQLFLFVLPFVIGGFFTYLNALAAIFLLVILILVGMRQGFLLLRLNLTTLTLLAIFGSFCITPLWAADRGMAVFGIVRFLPVLLYGLLLLQLTDKQRELLFSLLPICGVFMTVLSLGLSVLPATQQLVTVSGRLSGFFDYPNSFALFLLLGLVVQGTKAERQRSDWLFDGALIVGILASGSRTVFLLLLAAVVILCILRKNLRFVLGFSALVAGIVLFAVCLSRLAPFGDFARFFKIEKTSGSFFIRLLYMKDALPVILRNPFGLGYWGYRATLGTFQTGRYAVTFVHNGLLQLLLDIGWIPAGLLCASVGKTLFSKKASARTKLLLLVLLGHSLFDFNLQYLCFWLLLLALLDFDTGRTYCIRRGRRLLSLLGGAAAAVCLWLGTGDFFLQTGHTNACLEVTPFCTQAQITRLTQLTDAPQLADAAERILRLNKTCSVAYNAKANAAFSDGDILLTVQFKEQALRCNRYSLKSYCDYFNKLVYARDRYKEAGDEASAEYCRQKLLAIPAMLAQVERDSDPLAWKIGKSPSMELPAPYLKTLADLQNSD